MLGRWRVLKQWDLKHAKQYALLEIPSASRCREREASAYALWAIGLTY